jgi:hypothetical protein
MDGSDSSKSVEPQSQQPHPGLLVSGEIREWLKTIATIIGIGIALIGILVPFADSLRAPSADIEFANGTTSMTGGQFEKVSVTPHNYTGVSTMWVVVQSPNSKVFTQRAIVQTDGRVKTRVQFGEKGSHGTYVVFVVLASPQHSADFSRPPLDTVGGSFPDGVTFLAKAEYTRQ